ncbi:MAG: hypothetical protein GEV06_22455 [Luteitalea sp.]|nr:hypothetical protein [Luteitalea sp.]
MVLTDFQRRVCRLIAKNRIAAGESYVAGGAALNELIASPRISRDIDLFHDTDTAVAAAWDSDRHVLEQHGFELRVVRERPSYVEAEVSAGGRSLRVEWARDSAYRFFPLMEHEELGLVLHPFDLATNKVLALVGRLEVRDWVDVINSAEHVQPLGYVAWAASGKDPGFGPEAILEHAARSSRYSADEIAALAFEGIPPDAGELARRWHALLDAAHPIVRALPAEEIGRCVLTRGGELFRDDAEQLKRALVQDEILFHAGCLRGAFPQVIRDP